MKHSKQTIGQRIKGLREQKGLTQVQLGELVFVTDKTISKWEKDKSEPDSNSLVLLAEKLGVTLDYLLTGDNPDIENETVSRIELACREDNIALLDGIDFESFDDKGRNIDFYIKKFKSNNVKAFLQQWRFDKTCKEKAKKKSYVICAIPKGMSGDENLKAVGWDGPYDGITSHCAKCEKDGWHHFKIFTILNCHQPADVDFHHFYAKILNSNGQEKMDFQLSLCDDYKTGILRFTIYRDLTFKEDKHVDGKLVPDYYPSSDKEYDSCYYVKPSTLEAFYKMLNDLDFLNWECKSWGVPICWIAFTLKPKTENGPILWRKYYVAPGEETYSKFVKGIQQLFLDSMSQFGYKKFIAEFDSSYIPYYREELSIKKSQRLFKKIEEEQNEEGN